MTCASALLQARHLIVYPFISWLLSLIFLWPDEGRRCALTPNSDWTAPHPRYQPAPLWPWWPRSDHRGARRLSRCCCSACASGSLLQGAPCPPACAASAPWSAAPPALPQTPAGVRSADVAAQWTWTTAAKHIVSMLIVKCFSQGRSIIHLLIQKMNILFKTTTQKDYRNTLVNISWNLLYPRYQKSNICSLISCKFKLKQPHRHAALANPQY